jgi:hypothetical protein
MSQAHPDINQESDDKVELTVPDAASDSIGPKTDGPKTDHNPADVTAGPQPKEIGGRDGPEPTRFGDWEKSGRCIDF